MNQTLLKKSAVQKATAQDCNLYVLVTFQRNLWLDIKKNDTTGLVETQIIGRRSNLGKDSKSEAVEMIRQKLGIEIYPNDLIEKSFTNFPDKLNSVSQKCKVYQIKLSSSQNSKIKSETKMAFDLDYIKSEFAPEGMPLKPISSNILKQIKI